MTLPIAVACCGSCNSMHACVSVLNPWICQRIVSMEMIHPWICQRIVSMEIYIGDSQGTLRPIPWYIHQAKMEFIKCRRLCPGVTRRYRPKSRTSYGTWRPCIISAGANGWLLDAWLPPSGVASFSALKGSWANNREHFVGDVADRRVAYLAESSRLQPPLRVMHKRRFAGFFACPLSGLSANQRKFPFEKRCSTR